MTGQTPRLWLCDLTYTQQTIASDVMPLAIGCIASYAAEHLSSEPEIRIFKYPEKLAEALSESPPPDLIGFSNYVWNHDLSSKFAAMVKKHFPQVVTVFGGPNYPTDAGEQEAFLRDVPMFDFYIIKEAERAFTLLVEALIDTGFDPSKISADLPSLHRIDENGIFRASNSVDRIMDLADIPSPYLTHRLDEFFDGRLLPLIQTNRGCPFQCTFCVEGVNYYSRVAKTRKSEKVRAELDYVGTRMARLRESHGGRGDMFIADSNFGMYKEDLETCRAIAASQEKHGFPEYINVATGKNQKHRILEAAKILNGALRLSGSVQSLDAEVLDNIERKNINPDELMELALNASDIGANSYSEIILGLPGDTKEKHFKTIHTIVESDFNNVYLFQLMLLPGTDLASAKSVEKWDMKTAYRALPRCYGYFECLGEEIVAAEIEQICIGNSSLPFSDYLECRRLHLIVNVFYNDAVFKEVLRLIELLGLSKYEWLTRILDEGSSERFTKLVDAFLGETKEELWHSRGELRAFCDQRDTAERFIAGDLGANLIFKYKTLALTQYSQELREIAERTITAMFVEHGVSDDAQRLASELIRFAHNRMTNILQDLDKTVVDVFTFDVTRFSAPGPLDAVETYALEAPQQFDFVLSAEQIKRVQDYMVIYGESLTGLSRLLSKVYVRKLFRTPQSGGPDASADANRDLSAGQGALTGLTEFLG